MKSYVTAPLGNLILNLVMQTKLRKAWLRVCKIWLHTAGLKAAVTRGGYTFGALPTETSSPLPRSAAKNQSPALHAPPAVAWPLDLDTGYGC